jgi:hypothetical protein
MGWDSSVGTATRYGLEGPGIECRVPVKTSPEAHPASYTMRIVSFLGRAVDHPPPSSAVVKERVELYMYSPSRAFAACSRVKFTVYPYLYFIFPCVKSFRYHQMVSHYTLLFSKYPVHH